MAQRSNILAEPLTLRLETPQQVYEALKIPGLSAQLQKEMMAILAESQDPHLALCMLRSSAYKGLDGEDELEQLYLEALCGSGEFQYLTGLLRYLQPKDDAGKYRSKALRLLARTPQDAFRALAKRKVIGYNLDEQEAGVLMASALQYSPITKGRAHALLMSNRRQQYFLPAGPELDKLLETAAPEMKHASDFADLLSHPFFPPQSRAKVLELAIGAEDENVPRDLLLGKEKKTGRRLETELISLSEEEVRILKRGENNASL